MAPTSSSKPAGSSRAVADGAGGAPCLAATHAAIAIPPNWIPAIDAAKIRAFFIHPEFARRGLGTMLLERCEQAAVAHGFRRFELMATLPGVRLYAARGYQAGARIEWPVGEGVAIPFVPMSKDAPPPRFRIERATLEDAPAILALQKLAYQSEARLYDDWTLPPLTQTLEDLREEFSASVILKATEAGRLVGSVRAREANGVCQVGRLIVHPELQGRGVGTMLLRQIEAEFPRARIFELFTGSRSEGNMRLYQRLGYLRSREKVLSPSVTLVFLEKTAMSVRIVRLGSPRAAGEGMRLGTVRRPPRGVPKKDFARLDWYDVWFPLLAPSVATMKIGLAADTDRQWAAFARKYRAEMRRPPRARRSTCWRPCRSARTSRWAATARTSRAAIARCFASSWLKEEPNWRS